MNCERLFANGKCIPIYEARLSFYNNNNNNKEMEDILECVQRAHTVHTHTDTFDSFGMGMGIDQPKRSKRNEAYSNIVRNSQQQRWIKRSYIILDFMRGTNGMIVSQCSPIHLSAKSNAAKECDLCARSLARSFSLSLSPLISQVSKTISRIVYLFTE